MIIRKLSRSCFIDEHWISFKLCRHFPCTIFRLNLKNYKIRKIQHIMFQVFISNLQIFPCVSVGAKCKAGEYGVGTECKACGTDQTSPAKSDDKSDCVQGDVSMLAVIPLPEPCNCSRTRSATQN